VHELSIAMSVLESLKAEAERHPGAKFVKVGLRIGELAGIDRDSLTFGFEALIKETEWKALRLDIESVPRRQRCPRCHLTFAVKDYEFACPNCGELETACAGGDELDIAYVELEEP
jgi:hydrogenase nickel incorporation protein HypA/HybF